jgi:hypothetical protein
LNGTAKKRDRFQPQDQRKASKQGITMGPVADFDRDEEI